MPELTGPAGRFRFRGPANVRHRIRRDRADVQHQRRGLESKTNGVRFAAYARSRSLAEQPGALFALRTEPPGVGGFAPARGLFASVS